MSNVYHVDFKSKKLISKDEEPSEVSESAKAKLAWFSELIKEGLTQVMVDTNVIGVVLPEHLEGNPAAQINWSYKFQLPDFFFNEEKISGTLSFRKKDFHVTLPWESIWLISRPNSGNDQNKVWIEDMPKEVKTLISEEMREWTDLEDE